MEFLITVLFGCYWTGMACKLEESFLQLMNGIYKCTNIAHVLTWHRHQLLHDKIWGVHKSPYTRTLILTEQLWGGEKIKTRAMWKEFVSWRHYPHGWIYLLDAITFSCENKLLIFFKIIIPHICLLEHSSLFFCLVCCEVTHHMTFIRS